MAADIDEAFEHGLDVVDQVYGPGVREQLTALADEPVVGETVRGLFGEVWSRPHLSIRDRRLLVIGVTAMLGRPDLIETQVLGALRNGELDEAQLKEAVLMLSYYAGWGNGTAVSRGIAAAVKTHRAEQQNARG